MTNLTDSNLDSNDILAEAVLERTSKVYLWRVPICPFCGKEHVHGGGSVSGDPRRLLSHRAVHCATGVKETGYVLVEKGGDSHDSSAQ